MIREIEVLSSFLNEIGVSKFDFYGKFSIEVYETSDDNFEKIIDLISDLEERYGFIYQIFVMRNSFFIVSLK